MYVITGLIGFAVGCIMWYITSRWVIASIFWVEQRYPQVVGTKTIKVSEAIICGLQIFVCMALAFWLARLMVG